MCEAPPCATSRSTNTLLSFKVTTVAHHTCQNFCLLVVFYVCAYIGFQGHFHADKGKCLCLLVTTVSQGLCLFVVLSSVFHVFHLVTIVNYCHPCHEWQKKSSLPGDSTAACSKAVQSHFLLNILPRNLPRSIRACICVFRVF